MAQFRAIIQGNRGGVSRLGSKKSGLSVVANGWHLGIKVNASYDKETGKDRFVVYKTDGSTSGSLMERLAEVEG